MLNKEKNTYTEHSVPKQTKERRETLLTRVECDALRGLSIIGIFLHNYCHWLRPVVKENEYQYFQRNVDKLYQVLQGSWNELFFFHILSFFGHYGVPVFLFLSAYGLTMKYEKQQPTVPTSMLQAQPSLPFFGFIKYHWVKLFRMMIVGFVTFTMVDAITDAPHDYHVMDIIGQMGLFNNLLPNPDDIIWPGPYWFFGLMIQLYIVYRLFLYRRHWAWNVVLIVLCFAIQLSCEPESEALNRWRYNFIGGMLPFGFGVLYARYAHAWTTATNLVVFVLSLFAILLMSFSYITWYFVPLVICVAAITFVRLLSWIEGVIGNKYFSVMSVFSWVGSISAALFVCHPITRKIFIPISRGGEYWTGLLLYIISSLCLAWLFKELMKKIPSPKLK
ncbi:acyltransferase [Prevotella melaninogenica]|uniref:acyltransferase family protein n=1 Tax=Prevotella melaninogenica TaxID=28132 RepID=UPI001BA80C52|nr:acyltransferase [Prevotella melaninogenica]QUB67911.1 acyltransferase [Prevotella melaninogenica]